MSWMRSLEPRCTGVTLVKSVVNPDVTDEHMSKHQPSMYSKGMCKPFGLCVGFWPCTPLEPLEPATGFKFIE
jgi:hypothetical protein